MEQAKEANPLEWFIPNGAQAKAIKEVGSLENAIVIEAFANGVGKTSVTFAILAAMMWGAPTTAFDYPLYKQYPSRWPKMIRIATDSALVSDIGPIQVESRKWWPKGRYHWISGGKRYNQFFFTDTGFIGEVMTYEQAVKEYEGKTIGPTFFIEPPDRDIFYACIARQRPPSLNVLDMTPLTRAAWVLDDLISKPDIILEGKSVGKCVCINADIEENCIEHGTDGQYSHNEILRIISRYDPDELEARAHGKFMHLSGAVLKTFNRSVHVKVRERPSITQDYQVVDPAIGKPLAVIYAWVDETKSAHIYDEWPHFDFEGSKDDNLTVKLYADLFKQIEGDVQIGNRILDRHFGNVRRTLGGKTLKEEFSEAGIDFRDSYVMDQGVEVETGIRKIKTYLEYDTKKPIDSLNCPRLTIDPSCKNTILAMERWSRNPKTGAPLEAYKDFADCVRYLVAAEPEIENNRPWIQPKPLYYGVS